MACLVMATDLLQLDTALLRRARRLIELGALALELSHALARGVELALP